MEGETERDGVFKESNVPSASPRPPPRLRFLLRLPAESLQETYLLER